MFPFADDEEEEHEEIENKIGLEESLDNMEPDIKIKEEDEVEALNLNHEVLQPSSKKSNQTSKIKSQKKSAKLSPNICDICFKARITLSYGWYISHFL